MPYIKVTDRLKVEQTGATSAGELNFLFTEVIIDYISRNKLSYATINDVLGALEGAKLEFYRRVAVPYEEDKIATNTDVYPASFPR